MRDRIPKEEVLKWLSKIEKELKTIKPMNKKGEIFLDNINAYVNDCKHFMEKEDLFLSWECCLWAWAYLTIGKDLKFLE